jgi:hypothetical protein
LDDNAIILDRLLAGLRGARVLRVFAGPNTGSNLSLRLAPPGHEHVKSMPRLRPEQLLAGEIALFVECAWRLQRGDDFLVGSGLHDVEVAAYETIARMEGQVISELICTPSALDLIVTFENELRLHVFCDQFGDSTNYTVETESLTCAVAPPGSVVVDPKLS